jgi:hypothetical protein
MVSPQRAWDKINRMESKIMARYVLKDSKTIPATNEIINYHQSRWERPATDIELARNEQAMFDLKQDILKNLEALGVTEEDYLEKFEGQDFARVWASIGEEEEEAPKSKKKKKEVAEDA